MLRQERLDSEMADVDRPGSLEQASTNAWLNGHILHSRRAPQKEADRFLDSILRDKPGEAVLLVGLGYGYIVRSIYNRLQEIRTEFPDLAIFLYEPSPDWTPPGPIESDLNRITTGEGPIFFCTSDKVPALSDRFQVRIFPSYARAFPDLARAFQTDRNQNTIDRMMPVWLRSYTKRRSRSVEMIKVSTIPPLVFVGASPKLETEVEVLSLLPRDRCFLLAADAASGFLQIHGIKPDAYLSIDSAPATGYHLINTPLPSKTPVLTFSGGPNHMRAYFPEWIYPSDFPPEKSKGPISNGLGNLSGLAMAIAAASSGLILAIAADGSHSSLQSHCSATGYEYYGLLNQDRKHGMATYAYRLAANYSGITERKRSVIEEQSAWAARAGLKVFRFDEAAIFLEELSKTPPGSVSLERVDLPPASVIHFPTGRLPVLLRKHE